MRDDGLLSHYRRPDAHDSDCEPGDCFCQARRAEDLDQQRRTAPNQTATEEADRHA